MIMLKRAALAGLVLLSAASLAACSTTGDDQTGGIAANDQPSQVTPIQDDSVSSNALPPIPGASTTANSAPLAEGGTGAIPSTTSPGSLSTPAAVPGNAPATGNATPSAPVASAPASAADKSFVSLNDVGQVSATPGRNLAGGLTPDKLIGGWNVSSGAEQCRLNLTYTATSGSHYRASSPACQIQALQNVAAWQLSGNQVQLFDGGDKMIGSLLLSGNEFVGTLAGGRIVSMSS